MMNACSILHCSLGTKIFPRTFTFMCTDIYCALFGESFFVLFDSMDCL